METKPVIEPKRTIAITMTGSRWLTKSCQRRLRMSHCGPPSGNTCSEVSLLSFDEAFTAVSEHVSPLAATQLVPIESSVGHVLAEDILADDYYPRFDNSAMDGYAMTSADANGMRALEVVGTIAAGEVWETSLSPGTAARVFTGAPIPQGSFGVVMQEDVDTERDALDRVAIRFRDPVEEGENIRRRGSEIRPGDRLLSAGTKLNSGGISLLALAGRESASVRTRPRVAVLSTGDELIDHRESPRGSQIRNTNLPMLQALLGQCGVSELSLHRVKDDLAELRRVLLKLAEAADLVVVTGGVSVGGRDYLPAAQRDLGVVHFHGVAMRPGKPLLFGAIGGSIVFGLPGNPASSFVAGQIFVREAIRVLNGETRSPLMWIEARFSESRSPYGRDDFLRVSLEWREDGLWADPRSDQASFALRSLESCQGIARIPQKTQVSVGDICKVLIAV
jgi:molybdopterin molybdotransferase